MVVNLFLAGITCNYLYGQFHISEVNFALLLDKKNMSSYLGLLGHCSMKIVCIISTYILV